MSSRRLAGSVARRTPPATEVRQATVVELLPPGIDQATDRDTGWQVRLDYGGGDVRNASVAGTYEPTPGDRVIVVAHVGRLYVLDRIAAGGGDEPPGRLVAASAPAVGSPFVSQTGTAEVAVEELRVRNVPLRAGAAYEVLLRAGYSTSTGPSYVYSRLWQTGLTGVDLAEFYRFPTSGPTVVFGAYGRVEIANRTGVDLVLDLVPSLATAAGVTGNLVGTAKSPAVVEVNRLGPASRYPHAADVAVPPDA